MVQQLLDDGAVRHSDCLGAIVQPTKPLKPKAEDLHPM